MKSQSSLHANLALSFVAIVRLVNIDGLLFGLIEGRYLR